MLFLRRLAILASVSLVNLIPAGQAHSGTPLAARHIPRSHVLHERQPEHWAEHWERRDKVPGNAMLPMRIGLKQSNLEEGHDRLMEM